MPALTPEQEALKAAAIDVEGFPSALQPFTTINDTLVIATFSLNREQVRRAAEYYDAANPAAILALLAQLEAVQADTDKLLSIIACAYQIVNFQDAPAHILDVLSDPEAATMEQVEAMLPYQPGLVQAVPDGWIDVEDRLPPPETDVFVRVLRGNSVGYDVAGIFHGQWMSFATEADTKGAVTHWAVIRPVGAAPGELGQ